MTPGLLPVESSLPVSTSTTRMNSASGRVPKGLSISFVGDFNGSEADTSGVEDEIQNIGMWSSNEIDDDLSTKDDATASKGPSKAQQPGLSTIRMRTCLIFSFVILAILVPLVIYFSSRSQETKVFENQYDALSQQVLDDMRTFIQTMITELGSASSDATSFALATNATWPFVTLWDFDYISSRFLAITEARTFMLAPLVRADQRIEWEDYMAQNIDWYWEAQAREEAFLNASTSSSNRLLQEANEAATEMRHDEYNNSLGYSFTVWRMATFEENYTQPFVVQDGPGPYFPLSMYAPIRGAPLNWDIATHPSEPVEAFLCFNTSQVVMSRVEKAEDYGPVAQGLAAAYTAYLQKSRGDPNATYQGEPIFKILYPVFDTFNLSTRQPVGFMKSALFWERLFVNSLPDGANGIVVVVDNGCNQTFTYEINGRNFTFQGYGDHHDTNYDEYVKEFDFVESVRSMTFGAEVPTFSDKPCPNILRVYPSKTLQQASHSNDGIIIAVLVFCFFILLAIVALSYDWIVARRVRHIVRTEMKSQQIVSALFPTLVRDRLLTNKNQDSTKLKSGTLLAHPKRALKSYLDDGTPQDGDDYAISEVLSQTPIADSFLHCTVLFMDINGFSAWSSERGPEQVFTLLEAVFQALDRIAKRRGVFKVETIGESYVAVTGLPEPQRDHAVRMVRFARHALARACDVAQALETSLGPGTGDLQFRFGLHSGVVTAGVLRGEKARFQLFGDTVNTASRMESTGVGNRIQVSETTAELLTDDGKSDWIQLRDDAVNVKGKGVVKTYWVVTEHDQFLGLCDEEMTILNLNSSEVKLGAKPQSGSSPSRNHRLISWLVDLMAGHLQRVVAQREMKRSAPFQRSTLDADACIARGKTVLDEVVEAFVMPKLDPKKFQNRAHPDAIELSAQVQDQLYNYIEAIFAKYRSNPFHNFDHASHVTMSAVKLLNRIVVPEDVDYDADNIGKMVSDLHAYTYGITSDAMAQFAVLFSTLIHDVDHRGVPNGQLEKELPDLAAKYGCRSVAEQNSVDIAWQLLMEPRFAELRKCMFGNEGEVGRFRKYVVNLVMATDIFEKQMKKLRDERWNKAFGLDGSSLNANPQETAPINEGGGANLKATIILEHIIQAADVAHTMQHWKVYKKWNENLFQEMYAAYHSGRSDKDPSEGWYKGELWFFDNYVIPLAKRLEECGVFGVSSDECLTYAIQNRHEWEQKGTDLVAEMVERCKAGKKE